MVLDDSRHARYFPWPLDDHQVRAQVTALLAQAREDLDALDRALTDVERTGHVRCEGCGEPIALERVLALPTARTCIRCAPR